MTHVHLRRVALAGTGLAAAVVLAGCGSDDHHSGPGMNHGAANSPAAATSNAAPASGNAADVMFAQMMIPHHRQAVQMADLAATRSADPEVKQLAIEIKSAQGPEIDTMSRWLAAWGVPAPTASGMHGMGQGMPSASGSPVPGMDHGMPGMMSEADMTRLAAASGRDFDRQFVTMMIDHHRGAITMAEQELAQGSNTDAKALAQRIIDAQRAEINTMNKILDRL